MLPFAPARFSTTKGWPKIRLKSAASARARKSTEPPGGLVATMRTTCVGQAGCPFAGAGNASARANATTPGNGGKAMRREEAGSGKTALRPLPLMLGHGNDAARASVPQNALQGRGNLGQPDSGNVREELLVFRVALRQAVVRDPGRQVVNVVIGDVGGKPVQPARQDEEARAPYRRGIAVPTRVAARIRVLEIVLHGEEHDPGAPGERRARQVHDEEEQRPERPAAENP